MATFKSTEYTNATDGTGTKNAPTTWSGITYRYSQFTGQALDSSAGDIVQVMTIPSTVNVGYAAHTTQSSGAAVAIDADAFISALDAASARTVTNFHESGTHDVGYVTTGEMILTFSLGAGTSLAADTFDFHVMYADPN